MLSFENVDVSYGKTTVLNDISLRVDEGMITALFGRNGAGKTTLLKSYIGLLPIEKGNTRFTHLNIRGEQPHKICAHGIGYGFQERSVFPTLTVLEHFKLASVKSHEYQSTDEMIQWVLDLFPEIERLMDRKGEHLSGGEARMVELASAIIRKPRLLLLDEPLAGLSPQNAKRYLDRLHEMKDVMTTFIAEQNIRNVLEISDNFFILKEGRIIHHGVVEDIDESEKQVKKHIMR